MRISKLSPGENNNGDKSSRHTRDSKEILDHKVSIHYGTCFQTSTPCLPDKLSHQPSLSTWISSFFSGSETESHMFNNFQT